MFDFQNQKKGSGISLLIFSQNFPLFCLGRIRITKGYSFNTNAHDCSFCVTIAGVAKQVLDHCVVSHPKKRDPKNEDFEVVFDYSFVEDHRDHHTR